MLDVVEISNYQSHETSRFEFCPGINVIVGPSDNGKSAVLRAICWAIENKPDGVGFVSHWNLTDKGVLKSPTVVSLLFERGIITRRRGKDVNQYEIDGRVLDTVGRDVPPDVASALNMTEVNIQRQLDAHFLLSDSAGEVARILNRTIRLDDIDKLLALVEQKKRATRTAVEQALIEFDEVSNQIKDLEWIENVEVFIEKGKVLSIRSTGMKKDKELLEFLLGEYASLQQTIKNCDTGSAEQDVEELLQLDKRLTDAEIDLDELKISVDRFSVADDTLTSLKDLDAVLEMVDKAASYISTKAAVELQIEDLKESVLEYDKELQVVDKWGNLGELEDYVQSINDLQVSRSRIASDLDALRRMDNEFTALSSSISPINDEIVQLEESLPEICPVCNGTGKLRNKE
jgi:exonuclease SbcC